MRRPSRDAVAAVAELVDAADLKSAFQFGSAGSIPAGGTFLKGALQDSAHLAVAFEGNFPDVLSRR